MSEGLYEMTGLRFWREGEILQREQFTARLAQTVASVLQDVNQSWRIERVEAPLIMDRAHFAGEYTDAEVFPVLSDFANKRWALRAETTHGTYTFAQKMIEAGMAKVPLCLWQAGQSFRKEATDGARPGTLRFNQFWQQEFQCLYRGDTLSEDMLIEALRQRLCLVISDLVGTETRLVESDRIPGYATETMDIEALWKGEWKEVASTSRRIDFPITPAYPGTSPKTTVKVFEVAIGLDRLVAICNQGA